MDLCKGDQESIRSNINAFSRFGILYIQPISFFTEFIIAIAMTSYIFLRRNASQRPLFVKLQFTLLFFSNFCYCIVTVMMMYDELNSPTPLNVFKPNRVQNSLFAVGDLFLCLLDWLLTE